VAGAVEEAHFAEGVTILHRDADPPNAMFVIRSGAVELRVEEIVFDLLGEGECFGHSSLLAHEGSIATVVAHQDTLCYVVPAPIAVEVLESEAGRSYLHSMLRWVLHASGDRLLVDRPDARLHFLESFLRRPPVTIEPQAPVADAAALMASERTPTLLVPMRGGWGIITDRDLGTKVVAARKSHDLPVEQIATFPARTLPASATASDALVQMFAEGVHEFAVTDDGGRVLGVVTDTDLTGIGRHTPFALRSSILQAKDPDQVVARARELPQVVLELVAFGVDPIDIGRIIALVRDGVTERFLQLGIDELGDPPAAWAWLALGSAARQEQALRTDQDHALAWDGDAPRDEADRYFSALAERVATGLEAVGVPRCNGDAMATNAELRRPLPEFATRFRAWIEEPSLEHSVLSSTGFDFRWVSGPLDAEPALNAALREARSYPSFARFLARRALDLRPPTGFIRDFVVEARGEHAGRLDVKHGGITIITNLGRAWGLRAGATAKGTLARLDAAVAAGADADVVKALGQAFRYLWDIRLQHQARQIRAGQEPDDFVDPAGLGAFVRSGLKEAFRTIARAQRILAADFRIERR
jgi:CBS domain-containing protein